MATAPASWQDSSNANNSVSLDDYDPSKVHILVVDDDIITRKILQSLLRKYSYNVTVVASGKEAWDLLQEKKEKFDLVLTDVMMPAISGFTLLQMINEDESLRQIPVILMSGAVLDSKAANDTIKIGGQDYLTKPIGKEFLKKKVDMVLQNIWQKKKEQEYRSELARERHKGTLLAKQMEAKEHEIDELRKKVNQMTAATKEALESPIQHISKSIEKLLKSTDWADHEQEIKDQLTHILKELGSTNLYRPTFEKLISNDEVDPVTKSFLVTEFTGPNMGRRNSIPTFPESTHTTDTKEGIKSWDFDVFQYSESELMPMIVDMFENFQLLEFFHIPMKKLQRFIMTVHSLYRKENRYHNFTHAFDVTQASYSLLALMNAQQYLTHLDILALLISSLCHDLDHPGFNNVFQSNAQTELAINYNDISVLENHHSSLTFRVLRNSECNILESLNDDQFKELRRSIISLVLATDMANHFEYISKFQHHLENQTFDRNKKEDRQLILNFLLKCADLCNVAKPWKLNLEWSNRVSDEFFRQADFERDHALPVAPFMDRTKTSRPKIAADFIDFVAAPMFRLLAEFLPASRMLLDLMTVNRQNWQKQLEEFVASSSSSASTQPQPPSSSTTPNQTTSDNDYNDHSDTDSSDNDHLHNNLDQLNLVSPV
jgi:CheY-like chemotaxis protein